MGRGFAIQAQKDGSLAAAIGSKDISIAAIPGNYLHYKLTVGPAAAVGKADIDAIFGWSDAIDIAISDHHDIPHKLSLNPTKLKQLKALQTLAFTLSPSSNPKWRVTSFIRNLPNIQVIAVSAAELSDSQFQRFVQYQGSFNDWNIQADNAAKTVVFSKLVKLPMN